MTYTHFTFEAGADGIALLVWDSPGRSMNVFTAEVMDEIEAVLAAISADDAVTGVVVTSAKRDFSGGADLKMVEALLADYAHLKDADPEAAMQRLFVEGARMSRLWRSIETCGKPWVAAINGTCLGGAFELALACHGRIAAEGDFRVGLPEVKIGLFPGAGGTQRVMRMAEPQAGLTFLLQGQTVAPKKALALRLLDKVVPAASLVAEARAMIAAGLSAKKPWDSDGFRAPGGAVYSPAGFQVWPAANALYRRETHDNYPGARGALAAAFEGLQLPMDLALKVEARHFAGVLASPEAQAMIRSLFVSMQDLGKGARRPVAEPPATPRKVAFSAPASWAPASPM
ncbi:Fatty acid oxidation complex subunit alpha [Methylobrevis pamukkalensis]|uniref:Fatty acid oxidation complex subunit alpha n=1 Tax=Methylobrevis pamukkalensis TaxID=1439726 RepID=A0A1E3H7P0_9HYPH|nr:Fatty acid oxidation complex subunit alpha [Methylobrevis pamukkalensis]